MKSLRIIGLSLALPLLAACGRPYLTDEIRLQEDIDHLRLDHMEHWTALIEEYHEKQGVYPLQKLAVTSTKIGLVQIIPSSAEQHKTDWGDRFQEYTTHELQDELESGLGRKLRLKYPPESTKPTYAMPYNYFVEEDGYVFWVSCQSCGITKISTYTMDGKSSTVNIASEKMVPKVTKALTREDMLAHPRYKIWRSIKLHDEKRARKLEKAAAQ